MPNKKAAEEWLTLAEHDLMEIYSQVQTLLSLSDEELDVLDIATTYYIENRYPHSNYSLPVRSEIETVLEASKLIFEKIKALI